MGFEMIWGASSSSLYHIGSLNPWSDDLGLFRKDLTDSQKCSDTPPKTKMEAKNEGLEDDFPFQRHDFQVPC